MQKIDNPELSRLILQHLRDLYGLDQKREGIHLSTLVYCLTRSFFDRVAPIEATEREVMLFALGYGLQDTLTPDNATTPLYEFEGIVYRPDFQLKLTGITAELKTTRASSNKELPETWLEYIKGGCHILKIKEYDLGVLYMMGNWRPPFPEIRSFKLVFEDDELAENWAYLSERKRVYEEALVSNLPPQPFRYCKGFECRNCRYKLQCDAIMMLASREKDEGGRP